MGNNIMTSKTRLTPAKMINTKSFLKKNLIIFSISRMLFLNKLLCFVVVVVFLSPQLVKEETTLSVYDECSLPVSNLAKCSEILFGGRDGVAVTEQ